MSTPRRSTRATAPAETHAEAEAPTEEAPTEEAPAEEAVAEHAEASPAPACTEAPAGSGEKAAEGH